MPSFSAPTRKPVARVEVQHARRVAVNAHLFFDAGALHAVARTGLSVVAWNELRHDEQRDTLRAGRRVRYARQHQMQNVVDEVVLTGGDEDFRAGDRIGAVGVRHRLRAQDAYVRTGMRFGQAHRPGTRARQQQREEALLLLRRAVPLERVHRAVREVRIHRPRHIGDRHRLFDDQAHAVRQRLAAVCGGTRHTGPAVGNVRPICLFESLRRGHDAVLEAATFHVAGVIYRKQFRFGEPRRFVENRIEQVARHQLAIGQPRIVRFEVEHVVQQKARVAKRGAEVRHGRASLRKNKKSPRTRTLTSRCRECQNAAIRMRSGANVEQKSEHGVGGFDDLCRRFHLTLVHLQSRRWLPLHRRVCRWVCRDAARCPWWVARGHPGSGRQCPAPSFQSLETCLNAVDARLHDGAYGHD